MPSVTSTLGVPRPFVVAVHDISPGFETEITAILERLRPLVGKAVSASIIPCYREVPWSDHRDLAELVGASCRELTQHGFSHQRESSGGLLSWISGASDELAGLAREVACERLREGRTVVCDAFGRAPAGFVPPAFQLGRLTPSDVLALGYEFVASFFQLTGRERTRRLQTWAWDWGRASSGSELVSWLQRLRRASDLVPCIVLHPIDVYRDGLDQAIRRVEDLLAAGRKASVFAESLQAEQAVGTQR